MSNVKISELRVDIEKVTNLDAETSATNGSAVDMRRYATKTVWIIVTGNTGAVTVNIETSPDGETWFPKSTKTYTAVNGKDDFNYSSDIPFIRTTTTTQSNSTVTTMITGRS